mmetsp:Transcript_8695/g.13821  ORF Transcript_8695/g.13821 Transcript_8695/m.13821 type:complete len:248 (+) Transcript_8695:182-925(+)
MVCTATGAAGSRFPRIHSAAAPPSTSAPPTPPAIPAISGTLLLLLLSESESLAASPQSCAAQSMGPMVILGELAASACTALTPGRLANLSRSKVEAAPSWNTTSMRSAAEAELQSASRWRTLRRRRAWAHCSAPRSTSIESTCTVWKVEAVLSSSAVSVVRSEPWSSAGSMHACAAVSCTSTEKPATRSAGTSKALASMLRGETAKAKEAEFMPESCSCSASVDEEELWSSMRRRVQFSSTDTSANR